MAPSLSAWPSGLMTLREFAHYLMRMAREHGDRDYSRGERGERRERHEEHDGRRERGHRGDHRRHHVGRGDVYAATLLLLEEQSLHGYQIIQLIEERSGGHWRPSAGSVYPALQMLEDQGYVLGEQQESRRVFHLTDAGRDYITQHRAELVAARDAVTARVGRGDAELIDIYRQLETAFKQVVREGTPEQLAAAKELLSNTRRQLYRILADG
jgi:DNA-binding PadR family transcriptional regulator